MFLKNRNIIFKIRRSKVTDYVALRVKRSQDKPCGLALMNITWFMTCIVKHGRYNAMVSISVIVNIV